MLLLDERLEALERAAGLDQRIVGGLEAALLEDLLEDEGVSGGARVDRELLALEILESS